MDTAIKALKAGAFDFVSKPIDLHMLRNLVDGALKLNNTSDTRPSGNKEQASNLIGKSEEMQQLQNNYQKRFNKL